MKPVGNTPGRPSSRPSAPTPESWAFAEEFSPEPEAVSHARAQAASTGLRPLGRGATSLITVLATLTRARAVVEIGTGGGVSGLSFLQGMDPAGVITSVDGDHESQTVARKALNSHGVPNRRFRLILGQPLDVLPKLSDEAYDIVLINGDHLEYGEYVAQAVRLLRIGGLLIVNHALWHNRVAEVGNEEDEAIVIREALSAIQGTEGLAYSLAPIGDGLLLAVKKDPDDASIEDQAKRVRLF